MRILALGWAKLGPCGLHILGPSGAYVGPRLAYVRPMLAYVGLGWAYVGPMLAYVGPMLTYVGPMLSHLGGYVGHMLAILGLCWGYVRHFMWNKYSDTTFYDFFRPAKQKPWKTRRFLTSPR